MSAALPHPSTGLKSLRSQPSDTQLARIKASVATTLNDHNMIAAIRAAVFMVEQDCPYFEEFDGNDFSGLHLLAFIGREPVATLRVRWFASFCKLERVCVLPKYRGQQIERVLLAHAYEIAARKGYRLMIAQIQARLWPLWSNVMVCSLREDREPFHFSGYEYLEIDIPLQPHPDALSHLSDPYMLIRPEGYWHQAGILDQPTENSRSTKVA